MENKAIVYAVLAISLGYILVTAVPSRLAIPMLIESGDESDTQRSPPLENLDPAKDGLLSEDAKQGDFLSSESVQDDSLSKNQVSRNIISTLSTLSLNFIIALGVYFFVRRRYF